MLGAIIADVVGNNKKSFTDETIINIAIMNYMCNFTDPDDEKEIRYYIRKWLKKYNPLNSSFRKINDYRYIETASYYGYLCDYVSDILQATSLLAKTTHKSKLAVKAEKTIAMIIYKAYNEASYEEIADYAMLSYPKICNYNDEKIKNKEIKNIDDAMTIALYIFLNSTSFEDCLYKSLSINHHIACISCSIAEAFFNDVPKKLIDDTLKILPQEMKDVIGDVKWYINMK